MKKFIKFLIGIFLLPFVFIFIYNFIPVVLELIKNFRFTFSFIIGFILYCILHKYVYNFSRVYVFAHELSHAIAAWCCGFKVSSIQVKEESGQTKVSDVNTFVLLAPYCFPLYVVVCIIGFYIASLFWKDIFMYNSLFLGLLGFFMALHLIHTYKAITETEQSDIKLAGGGVFSFALIAVVNLIILILLIHFLFPVLIAPISLIKQVFIQTIDFWKMIFEYIQKGIAKVGNL